MKKFQDQVLIRRSLTLLKDHNICCISRTYYNNKYVDACNYKDGISFASIVLLILIKCLIEAAEVLNNLSVQREEGVLLCLHYFSFKVLGKHLNYYLDYSHDSGDIKRYNSEQHQIAKLFFSSFIRRLIESILS